MGAVAGGGAEGVLASLPDDTVKNDDDSKPDVFLFNSSRQFKKVNNV